MKFVTYALPFIFTAVLSGCNSGDRGCFGLCSKKDDSQAQPAPSVDRSCYADSTLGDEQELTYAITAPSTQQRLRFHSIASADMDNLRPVLIWVTGRTWTLDNEFNDVPDIARSLALEIGAHLALLQYRDAATSDWPESIADTHTAIRYLKTQAGTLNIDVNRFVLAGDRAGAHLASLAATTLGIQEFLGDDHMNESSRVSGAILLSGLYDFATVTADSEAIAARCNDAEPAISSEPIRELLDCATPAAGASPLEACDANDLTQASTTFHVSSDDPPMLLWHGTADCDYPPAQSEHLDQVLSDRSVEHVLNLIAGADSRLEGLTATSIEIELAGVLECE